MKDAFSTYHPLVNFIYFAMVIIFSMIFLHPACLTISILSAFAYSIYLNGRQAVKFNFLYMLPLLLVTALINPAFNHQGATILTYIRGNPLTLESIVYGVASAVMFISVICWFSCYNAVMTSDKFIYLFGRIIPALSLILSMCLRFVPRFKAQLKVVSRAQRCIGRDASGGFIRRVRLGLKILSIMVTWMLENAIETADSMKSRGYGLKGRTAFSLFPIDRRDILALAALTILGGCVAASGFAGLLSFRYFPTVKAAGALPAFGAYAALCFAPLGINFWEDIKWIRLQSNI